MLKVNSRIVINNTEIELTFIRSQGPGGQNVNKVATGVQLRFNVVHSRSLPESVRERLVLLEGKRINLRGELILKATNFRTQERNKKEVLERLKQIIKRACFVPKIRKKTKPTKASIEERLSHKKRHSKTKALRRNKKSREEI